MSSTQKHSTYKQSTQQDAKKQDVTNQDAMSEGMAAEQMNWEGDMTGAHPDAAEYSPNPYTMNATNGTSNRNTSPADWFRSIQTQLAQAGSQIANSLQPMQMGKEGSTSMENSVRDLDMREIKRWSALIGGGALALWGLRRSLGSLTIAGIGSGLVYYALTGRMPLPELLGTQTPNHSRSGRWSTAGVSKLDASAITTTRSVIVKGNISEIYDVWANFENFPHFMKNIRSVTKTGEKSSHWVMSGPMDIKLEWDAETTRQELNKRIAWSSTGGDIKTSGQVTFNSLPDEAVEVTVTLTYVPPAGVIGERLAPILAKPEEMLMEDLRNFKRFIETSQHKERTSKAKQPAHSS